MIRLFVALSMVFLSGAAAFGQVLEFSVEQRVTQQERQAFRENWISRYPRETPPALEECLVNRPLSVAFSPNGELMAIGCSDGCIEIQTPSDGKLVTVLDWQRKGSTNGVAHYGEVKALTFSPDGKYLVTPGGYPHFLNVWETATWEQLVGDATPTDYMFEEILFSPSGDKIWAYCMDVNGNRRIDVYDFRSVLARTPSGALLGQIEYARSIPYTRESSASQHRALSPDGTILAVAGNGYYSTPAGRVVFKKLADSPSVAYDFLRELPDMDVQMRSIWEIAFSPDGRYLVVVGHTGVRRNTKAHLVLFDLQNRVARHDIIQGKGKAMPNVSIIRDIAFSPDSRHLAAVVTEERVVKLFNIEEMIAGKDKKRPNRRTARAGGP